ncbi:MAG: hypothetical protein F6K53_36375 [Moorea sp. SIO4A1]|uniref:hypothetical protein n=1 Tax=Moorena sp. SIO4A1 TaxID=2607835 RepID=UPI0013BCA0A8|nr:hypothetical protein [Moorena sp. SIO4A1]NEQ62568.1 hypothetical protein [Moorena sp. SIO4A1]NEQ86513.1 hypothetical protein [Moorena sp. SIO2I5]
MRDLPLRELSESLSGHTEEAATPRVKLAAGRNQLTTKQVGNTGANRDVTRLNNS